MRQNAGKLISGNGCVRQNVEKLISGKGLMKQNAGKLLFGQKPFYKLKENLGITRRGSHWPPLSISFVLY